MAKTKLIAGGVIIVVAIAYLMMTGMSSAKPYYETVSEFVEQGSDIYGKDVRVTGKVDFETVEWDAENLELKFNAVDGSTVMPVVYHGVVPDTFDMAESVVLEGRFHEGDVFEADTLLVQCPSKYEGAVEEAQRD